MFKSCVQVLCSYVNPFFASDLLIACKVPNPHLHAFLYICKLDAVRMLTEHTPFMSAIATDFLLSRRTTPKVVKTQVVDISPFNQFPIRRGSVWYRQHSTASNKCIHYSKCKHPARNCLDHLINLRHDIDHQVPFHFFHLPFNYNWIPVICQWALLRSAIANIVVSAWIVTLAPQLRSSVKICLCNILSGPEQSLLQQNKTFKWKHVWICNGLLATVPICNLQIVRLLWQGGRYRHCAMQKASLSSSYRPL